jgi:monoamine oxidase
MLILDICGTTEPSLLAAHERIPDHLGGKEHAFPREREEAARRKRKGGVEERVRAGEHTSKTWQGYMNGAVESGLRAAEEVFATTKLPNGL